MYYPLSFLDIDVPTFNTSSQNNILVAEGVYLSVVCNANSNPPIWRYTWMTLSQPIRSDTLVFQRINRQHTGTYTCVAQLQSAAEKRSILVINVACKFAVYLFF